MIILLSILLVVFRSLEIMREIQTNTAMSAWQTSQLLSICCLEENLHPDV